jgi:tRNA-dihydrouridine synthase
MPTRLSFLPADRPVLALAPMQDVTDLAFMRVIARYGGPDVFYTEYFRVHADSRLDADILRSIDENDTGIPVIAQMIGRDIHALIRTAGWLEQHPVAGIDLNLGCPAPIVCSKQAGGGLLRQPEHIDAILTALRLAVTGPFTVKTRIGFDSPGEFPTLLDVFARHEIDALTVHGRTVREMYGAEVHYDEIARGVSRINCPVLANGNVRSAGAAREIVATTGVRGLMIGRWAIRNPWIFDQIRNAEYGVRNLREVMGYVQDLWEHTRRPKNSDEGHLGHMKKLLNYIAPGVGGSHDFLNAVRRCDSLAALDRTCREHLDNTEPFTDPEHLTDPRKINNPMAAALSS